MKKSYVKTVTSGSTAVLANGVVPIGNTLVTGYDKTNISRVGSSVIINDCYSNGYLVTVNATFTAPVAGTITLQVQQNGTNVVGGTASTTITTASTEIRSLSFTTIIKSTSGSTDDALTLVNTGLAATFTNVEFDVVRI